MDEEFGMDEAERLLGVSAKTIKRLIAAKRLQAIDHWPESKHRQWRFTRAWIDDYRARCSTSPTADLCRTNKSVALQNRSTVSKPKTGKAPPPSPLKRFSERFH